MYLLSLYVIYMLYVCRCKLQLFGTKVKEL